MPEDARFIVAVAKFHAEVGKYMPEVANFTIADGKFHATSGNCNVATASYGSAGRGFTYGHTETRRKWVARGFPKRVGGSAIVIFQDCAAQK
ncbi:MAG: hypothetical protein ACK4TA_15940 [Saprospiraceae bacterium]